MWFNQLKTVILLATLSGLLMLIGGLLGGAQGVTMALLISLGINFVSYFFSDKIVLNMYNAKPLDENKYQWLYKIIKELTQKDNLPMPKLWYIETPMANAFATGRNPANASIAVTSGILDILNEKELRGVLAHEISHVKNRDILVGTVAATLATAIAYLANMMQFMSLTASVEGERRKGINPFVMLLVVILMPLAATLIRMAVTRSREYLADETGAHLCSDPMALASALEKLQSNIKYEHLGNNDTARATTAHLFIVNPFTPSTIAALFSTHPPMIKRIERLRAIYETMMQN